MLDKLTKILNINGNEKKIELLEVLLDLAKQQILAYINEPELPYELEWICIKLAEREFNLNGATHLVSEGIDSINQSYKQGDMLSEYLPYIDLYLENCRADDKPVSSQRRVRLI